MTNWRVTTDNPQAARVFSSLEAVFALEGEFITNDPLSEVIRVVCGDQRFYVKRYWGGGKGLRRYLGRPRVKAEWQNLRRFANWGIAVAPVVAWGMERRFGVFQRGAMITLEVPDTTDMAAIARQPDGCLSDPAWVRAISRQLARATRILHEHKFVHNDLKWRNLLVNDAGELFLIDCPSGGFWFGPFLSRRIVKDLACLDKVAKYRLSRSQRLRFYLDYRGRQRLANDDKALIRKVLAYFEGRE
ncbi:lipopolysaccharide kinase InaA family protein [Stutzerimonas kirkiae]|uniref:Heptose kinase n=1 Tax=Stutzerimonas kirkiae TaxID=2211392 RepID=A0A4Q9R5B8_9GAMM|nr:lipopolysaccharide kinase InaA family protein [Stutzerimonas kirkiae]TBU95726.1 heptose kinase [Stutzerimonas kirkiae]TBV02717.1 heptose kinase [Stutzerimonas kirkiae]TBV12275.1 heptose kinase [Stutzerimonas kirkiae]TBV13235.1 heptose kinase [Stutzerimonas kirkiae]